MKKSLKVTSVSDAAVAVQVCREPPVQGAAAATAASPTSTSRADQALVVLGKVGAGQEGTGRHAVLSGVAPLSDALCFHSLPLWPFGSMGQSRKKTGAPFQMPPTYGTRLCCHSQQSMQIMTVCATWQALMDTRIAQVYIQISNTEHLN